MAQWPSRRACGDKAGKDLASCTRSGYERKAVEAEQLYGERPRSIDFDPTRTIELLLVEVRFQALNGLSSVELRETILSEEKTRLEGWLGPNKLLGFGLQPGQ